MAEMPNTLRGKTLCGLKFSSLYRTIYVDENNPTCRKCIKKKKLLRQNVWICTDCGEYYDKWEKEIKLPEGWEMIMVNSCPFEICPECIEKRKE